MGERIELGPDAAPCGEGKEPGSIRAEMKRQLSDVGDERLILIIDTTAVTKIAEFVSTIHVKRVVGKNRDKGSNEGRGPVRCARNTHAHLRRKDKRPASWGRCLSRTYQFEHAICGKSDIRSHRSGKGRLTLATGIVLIRRCR